MDWALFFSLADLPGAASRAPSFPRSLRKGWETSPQMVGAGSISAAAAGGGENLGDVERLGVRELVDLLAATEAVGDDDRGWAGGFNRWKQALVGNGL